MKQRAILKEKICQKVKFSKTKILFLAILLLALGVRLYSWPYGISQVNVDEAMTAINANFMAKYGVDMYNTSFPVYLEAWGFAGQSVILFYLMALCFKIFGVSMFSVRLPMLIISILAIIVFYDLSRKIFKNFKIALLGMAFLSICPWHFIQSIWSIDCNMFPHFMLFSIYFLYRGITEKKWLLYLSMVFFALAMYTYGVSVYIIPFFLLISVIYLWKKKLVNIKNIIICLFIYLLLSGPIFTMYFINALKINTNIHLGPITIQYFSNSTRLNDMIFFSLNPGKTLLNNIQSLGKTFFLQYDGLEWNASKIFGTIYHLSIFFFLIGFIHVIKEKKKQNTGLFFMLIWFLLSLLLGIIINDININRLNIIWYPTIFFSFYGIYVFCTSFKKKKLITAGLTTIYLALFISFILYFYTFYNNVIDLSGCFARKITDAIHYSNVILQKKSIFYGPNDNIYQKFQDLLDSTETELIINPQEFKNRIFYKKDNEAFIISENDLKNNQIDITNYQYIKFGDNYVIY